MMDDTDSVNETQRSRRRVLETLSRIGIAEDKLLCRLIEDAGRTYGDLLELVRAADIPEPERDRLQAVLVAGWERIVNFIFAEHIQGEEYHR